MELINIHHSSVLFSECVLLFREGNYIKVIEVISFFSQVSFIVDQTKRGNWNYVLI